jgi:hypothetical protein
MEKPWRIFKPVMHMIKTWGGNGISIWIITINQMIMESRAQHIMRGSQKSNHVGLMGFYCFLGMINIGFIFGNPQSWWKYCHMSGIYLIMSRTATVAACSNHFMELWPCPHPEASSALMQKTVPNNGVDMLCMHDLHTCAYVNMYICTYVHMSGEYIYIYEYWYGCVCIFTYDIYICIYIYTNN